MTELEAEAGLVNRSIASKVLGGIGGVLKCMHLGAMGGELYKALPELHREIDALIKSIEELVKKIEAA
jgi:hypothetical protein